MPDKFGIPHYDNSKRHVFSAKQTLMSLRLLNVRYYIYSDFRRKDDAIFRLNHRLRKQ